MITFYKLCIDHFLSTVQWQYSISSIIISFYGVFLTKLLRYDHLEVVVSEYGWELCLVRQGCGYWPLSYSKEKERRERGSLNQHCILTDKTVRRRQRMEFSMSMREFGKGCVCVWRTAWHLQTPTQSNIKMSQNVTKVHEVWYESRGGWVTCEVCLRVFCHL